MRSSSAANGVLEALGRARRVVHVQVEHVHPPQAALGHEVAGQPGFEVGADAADHAALRIGGVQGAAAGLQQPQVIRQRVAEFPRQGVVGIDRLVENLEVRHGPGPALRGNGAPPPRRRRRSRSGPPAHSSAAGACAGNRSLPAAFSTSSARAVVDQLADGKGSSTSTSLSRLSTRWICGSAAVKSNLPFAGSTVCHLADQSRHHTMPASRAKPHQEVPGIGVVEAERRVRQVRGCRSDEGAAQ